MSSTQNRELLITAEYKFHFLDDLGQIKFTNVNVGDFHAKPPKGGHSWGLRNIPRAKVVNALRGDGSLLVHCQIEVLPDPCKLRSCSRISPISDNDLASVPKTYVQNMRVLLKNGTFSDYKVVASGQEFAVHKCVLAAHSKVFNAMFAHENTLESETSTLNITDFSGGAVSSMLEYIYTGGFQSACYTDEILGLAEKYELIYLKLWCEDQLVSKLCKENVCETLALADLYNACALKNAALSFMVNCQKEIVASESWAQLKSQQPRLANEILEYLLDSATGESLPEKRQRVGSS